MDLRDLKDRAQSLFASRSFGKAADAFGKACAAAPHDLMLRQRWANALHLAGKDDQAVGLYREIASAYANEGDLLRAIAVNKLLLEIEPSHTDTQKRLADLYARRKVPVRGAGNQPSPARAQEPTVAGRPKTGLGKATTDEDRPAPKPPRKSAKSQSPAPRAKPTPEAFKEDEITDRMRLVLEDAGRESTDDLMVGGLPKPRWAADDTDGVQLDSPLFENLDSETFIELLQKCTRRPFQPGEVLIRQGDSARSFFVLVNGTLRVVQGPLDEPRAQIALAKLSSRDFFGEMALVSHSPRVASVIAETEGDALEFPDVILDKVLRRSAETKQALNDFIRARLLENAMASSEVFRPFDRAQRRHLFARFSIHEVTNGTSLLQENRVADAFYVIMQGVFRVSRVGEPLDVFGVGDTFGEVSLLTQSPATASVIAEGHGRVLRLPAASFQSLVAGHPAVKVYAKALRAPSSKAPMQVATKKVAKDIEGVVLV